MIPPAIDPRALVEEIEATVSEFNRLANLASSMNVAVLAEVHSQRMIDGSDRAVLMVQVIAP